MYMKKVNVSIVTQSIIYIEVIVFRLVKRSKYHFVSIMKVVINVVFVKKDIYYTIIDVLDRILLLIVRKWHIIVKESVYYVNSITIMISNSKNVLKMIKNTKIV